MKTKTLLTVSLLLVSHLAQGDSPIPITVFRSPTCGCCLNWINHLKQNNFLVNDRISDNMQEIKNKNGVKNDIASCHTALTGGYVIEGHVHANDIKKLLKNKPSVFGIAVPGMPSNSPGMEAHAHTATNSAASIASSVAPKAFCGVK